MKYYVYQICRPDGTPFYIGSGKKERLRGVSRNNALVTEILAEIRASGRTHSKIVEEFDDESSARIRELELIVQYGRIVDGGILANMRIGDRGGVQGRKLSEEHVAKLHANRQPHTEETKKHLSETQRVHWTPERRAEHGRLLAERTRERNCRNSRP